MALDPYNGKKQQYTDEFYKNLGRDRQTFLRDLQNLGYESYLAKKKKKEEEKAKRELEKAAKAAAKKAKESESEGKKKSKVEKDVDNAKFRLESAGVDTSDDDRNAVEKFLNLPKKQNAFFDVLDILNRPSKAVMNVLNEGAKDKKKADDKYGDLSDEDYVKKASEDSMSWKEMGKLALDGLTGKSDDSGSDVLGSLGVKNKVAKGVGGFALEVATDPLSLLPTGLITKGVKSASKGIKAITPTPVKEAVEKVSDPLGAIFNPNHKIKETLEGKQSDDLLSIKDSMKALERYEKKKSMDTISSTVKDTKGGLDVGVDVGKQMEKTNILNNASNVLSTPTFNKLTSFKELNVPAPKVSINPLDDILTKTLPRLTLNNKTGELLPNLANPFAVKTDIAQTIINHINDPRKAVNVLAKDVNVQNAAKSLVESNDTIRRLAQQFNIDIPNLAGYMAHVMTDEAKKALKKGSTGGGKAFNGGNDKVLNRSLKMNVDEANEKLGKKYGTKEFFNPNAFFATAVGQHRVIEYVVAEATKRSILDNTGFARKYAAGSHVPNNAVKINVGDYKFFRNGLNEMGDLAPTQHFGEYVVTKAAKRLLDNYAKKIDDEGIESFVKAWDKGMSLWKQSALFSAGYHVGNAIGNTFNMWVGGMSATDLTRYNTLSTYVLHAVNKGTKKGAKAEKEALAMYDEFSKQGLTSGSQYDIEFAMKNESALMKELKYQSKGALGKLGANLINPVKGSQRAGTLMDEAHRLTAYMWARKTLGLSPEKAAAKVKDILFDYDELTEAERRIRRWAIPFYTFMRKNAEFQVKAFANDPQKYAHVDKLIDNAYKSSGIDPNEVVDYKKESMRLPIGQDRMFNTKLPAADLVRNLPGNAFDTVMDSSNPLIKLAWEMKGNKKMFTGAPIQKFEGETTELLGQEMSPKAKYALESLAPHLRRADQDISAIKEGNYADVGNLSDGYDKEKDLESLAYDEKQRLEDMIKAANQKNPGSVKTVTEYEKQGLTRDEKLKTFQKKLKQLGLSKKEVLFYTELKKKVQNNDAGYAVKVREQLEASGVPKTILDEVTLDYLEYDLSDYVPSP